MVDNPDERATITELSDGNESVKAMGEDLGPGVVPEMWDGNKVYMYEDPDGNKVPVPIGWTVSGAESEKWVNHNVAKTGTLSNLTFTPGEKTWEHDESDIDNAWILNEDNVWVSQNYHVASSNSRLVSDEITVGEDGGYLSIECSVSSEAKYSSEDKLYINIKNVDTDSGSDVYSIRGSNFGSTYAGLIYPQYRTELESGRYIVTIGYTKNASGDSGLDRGYVKSATILNYDDIGEESIIVHEYGGLVIYEGTDEVTDANAWEQSKTRNQFVWVPVTNPSRIYETNATTGKKKAKLWLRADGEKIKQWNNDSDSRQEPGIAEYRSSEIKKMFSEYNLQGYTKYLFYKELQSEFDKTMESIERYGGFYVGRYETGNISYQTPVVRRLNENISDVNWYNMYLRMKNISSNENIQTSMIWGCLFDEIVEWLLETGEKTIEDITYDLSNWGNYYPIWFDYIGADGSSNRKGNYQNRVIPTGSTERHKANNIYDISGNVAELTLEVVGDSAYCRGGNCNYTSGSGASLSRRANIKKDTKNRYYGFRAYFYIK